MPYNGTGWTLPAAEGENWEYEHLIKSNKPVIYDNEALPYTNQEIIQEEGVEMSQVF